MILFRLQDALMLVEEYSIVVFSIASSLPEVSAVFFFASWEWYRKYTYGIQLVDGAIRLSQTVCSAKARIVK